MRVSCVCCTYGRFSFLRRSVAFWLNQDYADKELIIFNTAATPIELDASLSAAGVRVVNQQLESSTGLPYRSLGAVRADALRHAHGDIYVCWDDDDLFLPWHLSQGVEQLQRTGRAAWMPSLSYFSADGGVTYRLDRNAFEASVLVRMSALRRYGFDAEGRSGAEHLPWRIGLVQAGELREDDVVTPFESYAYIWGEAGHKMSSTIDQPGNFETHMAMTSDFGSGDVLRAASPDEIEWFYVNIAASQTDARLHARMNRYLVTTRV